MLDADAYCAALSTANIVDNPTKTASYLEVRISADMAIQRLWSCTSSSTSELMGFDWQIWMLRGTDTAYWDNCHHLLLQLHTSWAY